MKSLVKTTTTCCENTSPNIPSDQNFDHAYKRSIQTKTIEHDWATCTADSLVDNER